MKGTSHWIGWKQIVNQVLEVFDDTNEGMTIQEMYHVINIISPTFLWESPYGGKTTRNTLSSVCTNGVKTGTLIIASYVDVSARSVVNMDLNK